MATINGNTVTIEDSDVLDLFARASAVLDLTDGDIQYSTDFLVEGTETEGGTTTRVMQKVNAAVVKAYLASGMVKVDASGNVVINGQTTELNVNNPIKLRMYQGTTFQYSTDNGATWTNLFSYSDVRGTITYANNLTTASTMTGLAANQGKVLKQMIDDLDIIKVSGSDETIYPDY